MATALLAGCSGKQAVGGEPVVSVEPQRALLQQIVGDRHQVQALLAKNADPESFEPTMKTRMALDDAPVYFATGLLPFEASLTGSMSRDVRVVKCSEGIDLIYGTHGQSHGDGHGHEEMSADPHIWASVKNARVMAATMTRAMKELEPENADYYQGNFERLDSRLDSLDRAFTERVNALPDSARAFAIWHPSLTYLARDYGLQQIAVGFENKEMSPAHLARITAEARGHGVRVLFFQAEYDTRQAESLNAALGTRLVTLNPLASDWEAQLNKAIDAITAR